MTKKTLVGVQFLFVAFGATVLVPLLIGIDPATALFTAGVGTFLFHFITKGNLCCNSLYYCGNCCCTGFCPDCKPGIPYKILCCPQVVADQISMTAICYTTI